MMSTEFVIFLFQMISPIVGYTKWDCKILFWVSISCFFIIQIVTMIHGLKAWSLFGIRYIHQTKTDVTSLFFCNMWRHTMTRYCGQKRKDNTSSHGVRAYPWILSKKYWSVCPFVRAFVCAFVPMGSQWECQKREFI